MSQISDRDAARALQAIFEHDGFGRRWFNDGRSRRPADQCMREANELRDRVLGPDFRFKIPLRPKGSTPCSAPAITDTPIGA